MGELLTIYFSGTGNTKYVATELTRRLNYADKHIFSIEDEINFEMIASSATDIMVAYPICGGNMPIIMREFARRHASIFWGKRLITIVTQAGFSGDGGALMYNYLADSRVKYLASAHVNAPTNVSFGKIITIKNGEELASRKAKMDRKIAKIANRINADKRQMTGRSRLSYLLGYHLQRKYFERIEDDLRRKFSVDNDKCLRCQRCVSLCPMGNIIVKGGNIVGQGNCTLCYRCVHACPVNAITILGREPIQYKGLDDGTK